MEASIRILLAGDHVIVRSRFRSLLDERDGLDVIGEASSGAQAVERTQQEHPDVVLMDIRAPWTDGLSATRQITGDPDLEGVRVIMVSTFDRDEAIFEALHAGARGVLRKDMEPDVLCEAVRAVARGDALLCPTVTRRLIEAFVAQPGRDRHRPAELATLTAREREIMGLVGTGLTNDEIAEQLLISPATVKTHASRLRAKLAARDRSQLVMLADETVFVGRSLSPT